MTNFPDRQSIRLNNYNYSQSGYYYVTICTENRIFLFGNIINGNMIMNYPAAELRGISKTIVIPAQAGIYIILDSCFRRNDNTTPK